MITFSTSSSEGNTILMPESYNLLMSITETDYQCPKRNTYTVFLKFEFSIIKTHSQKFILDCNVSLIYKHKDKQNLLSHNNLSFFQGKFTRLFFWKLVPQPPSPLKSEGDPAMINQKRLILLSFGKRENTGGEGYNSRWKFCWTLSCIKRFNSN